MNKHIEQYLDYYINLSIEPEYAILLRGNWGSGKTWFIKNYLEKKQDVQSLYVSLNGISTFNEIEDSFFQQLHPVLASTGMKLAGKILKGVLKTTIKVDLDNDDKADGSFSASTPDINLPDYFKNLDNNILIFDDLERCAISIPNILGYINQFVEINGLKVIILGNENEIIRRENVELDEESVKYLQIKEKVIGKSFDVLSNIKSAVENFINQLSDEQQKLLLKEKENLIVNLFNHANYGNLRHLRQSILDFERFSNFLPDIATNKSDLINHIIELFFIVSFELKKGAIAEDDIFKIFRIDYLSRNDKEKKSKEQEIREKYSVLGKYYHPFDDSFLTYFFKYGIIEKESLENAIKNSIYFQEENTPDWIKLWRYFELNDDEFDVICNNVLNEFNNYKVDNKYVLLQISGLLLTLSEDNLILMKKKEVLDKAKTSIDKLKVQGLFTKKQHEEFPIYVSHGLKIQGIKFKEFIEIFDYAKEQVNNSISDGYPEKAEELLNTLNKSIETFGEQITLTNSRNNIYYDTPILKYIPVNDFVTSIIQLKNKDKRDLCSIFEERYRHMNQFQSLTQEIDWFVELHESITKEKDKYTGKVSGLILNDMLLKVIEKIVDSMELITLGNNAA
ncbi:MAG: hypothetical protein GQ564_21610 [Bacteroidales bacterium]|nr:hypothetical protein [Bacteroidales bacterium]